MGTILTDKPRSRSGYSKTRSRQTPTYDRKDIKYRYVDRHGEPTIEYWNRQAATFDLASHETMYASMQRSGKVGRTAEMIKDNAGTNFGEYTPRLKNKSEMTNKDYFQEKRLDFIKGKKGD
tara:strand:+ start:124 stop:486 length:363 start_codon:yes stop_codon:yes gene_type:complete